MPTFGPSERQVLIMLSFSKTINAIICQEVFLSSFLALSVTPLVLLRKHTINDWFARRFVLERFCYSVKTKTDLLLSKVETFGNGTSE